MTFSMWPDIHPSWQPVLEPVAEQLHSLMAQLQRRRADGERIEPPPEQVLRVFRMPLDDVKVLIVGQDPYPTPGHSVSMCLALDPHVRPLVRFPTVIFAVFPD